MSTLLSIERAGLAYGLHPLLDEATLAVTRGERIGLIGRNGTGKSSLLGVIAGRVALDDGVARVADGLRVILVEQEPELAPGPTLLASLLARAAEQVGFDDSEHWRFEARLREFLQRFGLDAEGGTQRLSGGERKRAALALALALAPDLLLLDEPTNHLDIDGITLLEELLLRVSAAIVITHDRAFLDRFATRIVELDRGLLRSYPGNFATYESRKAEQLAAEQVAARKFDAFWAQEEVWIRQGIKARRTRDEGRVRRLERLRAERAERRERIGKVRLHLDAGARSGKLVAELERVDKQFGGRYVVRDLSLRLLRGDRIGLIGPNGAGKSTLIRLILGQLAPDAGTVRLGSGLEVAYFDQMRAQLDARKTLIETISPGSEWVETGGQRRHVISYLADFLFPSQRANSPVGTLSGGERNRLLLARLFARPANLLVLDEPTNDLDIESLELLETTLQGYDGTLLLVTHDRVFLDNVVTQTLVAEGDGRWQEYAGGYSDWLLQRPQKETASLERTTTATPVRTTERPQASTRKLGFREQRELAELPVRIEALEQEQAGLLASMANAPANELHAASLRAAAIGEELEAAFVRWSELEERANAG
ncbi:MAG: ATP-binding cassette domain-containing protein [Pseudomonadales bacterium]|jgi:ATP-binding cassette subfamily F protein uup|nr:ATP-binding cassette domain-containing protein [Pseudomonadales bacterium]MCP5337281.1 ATP-binding cassette domain-containing protein [Pseudomonadales bacterium]